MYNISLVYNPITQCSMASHKPRGGITKPPISVIYRNGWPNEKQNRR
jgi:hypothetical protein